MTWRESAACAGMDTRLWFDPAGYPEALAVCAGCLVQTPCLSDALKYPPSSDVIGIRGGMTAKERRTLRRDKRGKAA